MQMTAILTNSLEKPEVLSEQFFIESLAKNEENEEKIAIYLEYIKWLEKNKRDQAKIFSLSEKLLQIAYNSQKYKNDEQMLKKWLHYANMCEDSEEVLLFMRDHEIGLNFTMFFEVLAIIYEKKRDFQSTNRVLLEGLQRKAQPLEKMEKLLREFEERMLQRLDRDFYSKGLSLDQENLQEAFSIANEKPEKLSKKRKVFDYYDDLKESSLKRLKKIESKARETVKIGEIEVYVDKQFRDKLNISSQLVDNYANLCKKYQFFKETLPKPLKKDEEKPLSWISRENLLYNVDLQEKISQNKDNRKKNTINIEKPMPKIVEEPSSIGSSAENQQKSSIYQQNSDKSAKSVINSQIFNEKTQETPENAGKGHIFMGFTEKIEGNICGIFSFPHLLGKSPSFIAKLQSSQKKSREIFSKIESSLKKSEKVNEKVEISPIKLDIPRNFASSSHKNRNNSLFYELEDFQKLDFKNISSLFSEEKEKLLAISSKKSRILDFQSNEIEKVRCFVVNEENSQINATPNKNFEKIHVENSVNDQAFIMDSNEKNESNDDIINILNCFEEKENSQVNLKKEHKNVEKRQALKEISLEQRAISHSKDSNPKEIGNFSEECRDHCGLEQTKNSVKKIEYHFEDDDFADFFWNNILNQQK